MAWTHLYAKAWTSCHSACNERMLRCSQRAATAMEPVCRLSLTSHRGQSFGSEENLNLLMASEPVLPLLSS